MNEDGNYLEYDEDLKALKRSIETVKKLNWNNEKKTSKSKKKEKNTAERNAA